MMKTFLKKVGVSSSRARYVVEVSDGLMVGVYHEKYFEEDLRRALDKRKKDKVEQKVLLIDAGRNPWMMEMFAGEIECVPCHLGPFHTMPTLHSLFEVVGDMYNWFHTSTTPHERRVAVIVASSSGSNLKPLIPVALLAVCYLDYMDLYESPAKAIEHFRRKISDHDLINRDQLKSKIEVTNALYYINVFHGISGSGTITNDMPLLLTKICVVGGITLPGPQRWNPMLTLYTYAVSDENPEKFHRVILGGPGDEEHSTVTETFCVFNLKEMVYGDFLLNFEHWIPLINQTQPLFSVARHSAVLTPPEHVVEIRSLEIAPGQAKGLQFDGNFRVELYFEEMNMESEDATDEELLVMDRVDCYLEAIEEIAPQSRRAARRRVEEATRRRNAIQTALPTGNEKSIGLGLHQGYPVTELSDALDALPPEEMDNFLQAFKTFQKTTVGRDRTDDMAQLLAEAGFTIDENNELMIDAEVEEGLVVSMNDLGFDTESEEPGSAEKKSRSRRQGSSAAGADGSGFVEESGESEASGEGGDSEYESGSGDSNSPAGRTSPDSAAEQERLLDEFILAKLMKVETERKINLTDPSTSWLDVADVVHTELLADVNKDMVEIYSSQYRKPVALSRKLRKLHKQMLAEKALETPHAELDAADLDLPGAPAPSIPDAPSVLVDDWSLDLPEIAPIKRRVSNKKSRSRAKASGTTQFQLRRSIHGSKAQKKELRPLHWNKISDKVVDKTAFAMAAPQVDLFEQLMEGTDEIDNLFASGARPTSDPMIHKVKSAGVLETKRQMNFEIMLSMFPDELQSIFDAIENLDPFKKRLSDDQVQILDNQPLSNEETKLGFQYSGGDEEFMELSHGEQFAILVARNSAFPKMVKAAAVLRSYRETVTGLEEDARVLRRAVREVKSSESFRSFIAVVLSVGNFLNEGTHKGDAQGFRLEALPKLADIRSKDKNLSLLHYVIQVAKQKDAGAIDFVQEFVNLEPAMRKSKEELGGAVNILEKDIETTREVVVQILSHGGQSLDSLEARAPTTKDSEPTATGLLFLNAESTSAKASGAVKDAIADFEDLAGFLGENSKRTKIEGMLGVLLSFCKLVERCNGELEDRSAASSSKKKKSRS